MQRPWPGCGEEQAEGVTVKLARVERLADDNRSVTGSARARLRRVDTYLNPADIVVWLGIVFTVEGAMPRSHFDVPRHLKAQTVGLGFRAKRRALGGPLLD